MTIRRSLTLLVSAAALLAAACSTPTAPSSKECAPDVQTNTSNTFSCS